MHDSEKSNIVKWFCEVITNAVTSYENDSNKIFFDYDGVLALLEQAQMLVVDSARCPRPENLPTDMAWGERLGDGGDVFDPYVYTGSMSADDFEMAKTTYFENEQSENEDLER